MFFSLYLFKIAVGLGGAVVKTIAVTSEIAAAVDQSSALGMATLKGFTSGIDVPSPVIRQRRILIANVESYQFKKKTSHFSVIKIK